METRPMNINNGVLLTAAILMAQIDMSGLVDCALKVFVAGGVWFGFKVTSDYLDRKIKAKQNLLDKDL